MTISGGATRIQDEAEYFGSVASTNCGDPSRDRCQSDTVARTRTGSVPLLLTVTACVVVPPGAAFSSSRSGVTSTDVCAAAGEPPNSSGARQGEESVKMTVCV